MIVRDSRRRPLLEWGVIALTSVAIGLAHRRAWPDPLADDRLLTPEPSWFQLAAPLWHAAIASSTSLAQRVTSAWDPWTAASSAGDTRALAALAVALAALLVIVVLRATRVPLPIALLLASAPAGSLLPVAASLTATHAIQMMTAAAMIWLVAVHPASHRRRLAALAALTIIGSIVHASFVAFAGVLWAWTWYAGPDARRRDTAGAAVLTLAAALLAAAWPLYAVVSAVSPDTIPRPRFVAFVVGLVTGRFPDALQPLRQNGLGEIVMVGLGGPAIVTLPLALFGLLRRDTRPLAGGIAAAAVALCLFQWGSWLPDPTVAVAPARIAVLVLAGLGLSWLSAQPVGGATAVAVVASLAIASSGWLAPSRFSVAAYAERLRVFVSASAAALHDAAWASESLATARALHLADPRFAARQIALRPEVLRMVPADQPVLVFANRTTRVPGLRESTRLRYESADDFLAALPDWSWLAVAASAAPARGFCGDLLTGMHAAVESRAAVLAPVGDIEHDIRALSASNRLEVTYGERAGSLGHEAPAHFAIEAATVLRVAVNGTTIATAPDGMVVVVFDPWARASDHWVLSSCAAGDAPAIHDAQLHLAYWIDGDPTVAPPAIPVLDDLPIAVPLGIDGKAWLGEGWHDAESGDGQPFRWTRSRDAHVNVLVSHRQPVRVQISGGLAATSAQPNAMTLVWNGTPLGPPGAWKEEWAVPASDVRRGHNVLTIRVLDAVSPPAARGSGDTRLFGARITGLTLAPGRQ